MKGHEAVQDWTQSLGGATRGTGILTRSVGSLSNVLGAIGIAAVPHQLGSLSVESIRAAGSMQQLEHATTQVLGSVALAKTRFEELVVVANYSTIYTKKTLFLWGKWAVADLYVVVDQLILWFGIGIFHF